MRFGSSTLLLQERSVCEALEGIARCGFQAAEVWIEHLWRTGESPEKVARWARALELELSLHGASYDVNISSTNPGIRRESLCQAKESIVTAARLGAEVVVLHPGRLSSSRGSIEECWKRLQEAVVLMDEWADREGVKVGLEAMENRPREVYVSPADVHRLLSVGWTNIGLTLDIAHAYTLMDPVDYVAQLDSRWIIHVHLSDSTEEIVHVPLGHGQLDINAILRALSERYDGLVILEGYVPNQSEETVCSNRVYLQRLGWM